MQLKTYCDLAIKVDGKLRFLLEAKAIGLELKDDYIKQALIMVPTPGRR